MAQVLPWSLGSAKWQVADAFQTSELSSPWPEERESLCVRGEMGGLTIGRDIPNNEGNKTKSIYPALCESKSVRNDRVKGFGNEVLSWPLPGEVELNLVSIVSSMPHLHTSVQHSLNRFKRLWHNRNDAVSEELFVSSRPMGSRTPKVGSSAAVSSTLNCSRWYRQHASPS